MYSWCAHKSTPQTKETWAYAHRLRPTIVNIDPYYRALSIRDKFKDVIVMWVGAFALNCIKINYASPVSSTDPDAKILFNSCYP